MSEAMRMRRVPVLPDDTCPNLEPGDVCDPTRDGYWLVMTPSGHLGTLRSSIWTVIDNGDMITVTPSIRISTSQSQGKPDRELWHGYLTDGEWRPC